MYEIGKCYKSEPFPPGELNTSTPLIMVVLTVKGLPGSLEGWLTGASKHRTWHVYTVVSVEVKNMSQEHDPAVP